MLRIVLAVLLKIFLVAVDSLNIQKAKVDRSALLNES